MKKIEAQTLELAYADAASWFSCSVTQLNIEVVQAPSKGFLGFFKKPAIIVVVKRENLVEKETSKQEQKNIKEVETFKEEKKQPQKKAKKVEPVAKKEEQNQTMLNDTIMPASFVSDQDDEDEDLASGLDYTADYDDEYDEVEEIAEASKEEPVAISADMESIAKEVEEKVNNLFKFTCFSIEKIEVSAYDAETLLIEFKGDDVALLIGKEGYRYKALSYMIFNWINSSYDVQLRLEIAEFLQNQEESMGRYLESVCDNVDRSGKAQTKILDGVLLQIALKELREKYPQKYVVIRSTRDGLKYILVADYYN